MFESFFKTFNDLVNLSNLQVKPYSDSPAELRRSLERTEAFLEELGAPQEKLKFIHVTGTSGKGSVCNYLHEMLVTAGKKVGSYTSPHTTSYLERFRVNHKLIPPGKLVEYMRDVMKAYQKFLAKDNGILSYFELSTCLALYAFERMGLEWCILEVGLGGRFDATNIIPAPRVAVITNIDKDHTDVLGNSLAKIAYEKAGIIKHGSTVFCGEQRPKLREIFKTEAVKENTALFFVSRHDEQLVDLDLGKHQQENALIAARAAEEIGLTRGVIEHTLENVRPLPCRFETIQKKPHIVLDGAHSPAKMQTTADRIKDLFGKAHIIIGVKAGKDATEMLKIISPVAKSITTTRFATPHWKAVNPSDLLSHVAQTKRNGYFLDYVDALEAAKRRAKNNEPIVVTGSLYLAGEMRSLWIPEEEILKHATSFPFDK